MIAFTDRLHSMNEFINHLTPDVLPKLSGLLETKPQ